LDRDSSHFGRLNQVLQAVRKRQVDILVGTQMVTKGHDFPGVTLVGVILADHGLNFPDFRSAERTFQLLCQVAGRAGRGDDPGRVIIQTYNPQHHSVVCAKAHDYRAFFEKEHALRQRLGYPPAGHLAAVRFDGTDPETVPRAAQKVATWCHQNKPHRPKDGQKVEVIGPSEAPLGRLRGRTRWHLLLRCRSRLPLHELLAELTDQIETLCPPGVRAAIDVDPLDMM
jgi:primosomal protein N' (replication factor Y)